MHFQAVLVLIEVSGKKCQISKFASGDDIIEHIKEVNRKILHLYEHFKTQKNQIAMDLINSENHGDIFKIEFYCRFGISILKYDQRPI